MGIVPQHISDDKKWFVLNLGDSLVHKGATSPGRKLDPEAADKIVTAVKHFGVFAEAAARTDELSNIAIEIQAINKIKEVRSFEKFMLEQLILDPSGETTWNYKYVMKNDMPLIRSSMYEIPKTSLGKDKLVQTDRAILQSLIMAYKGGRTIELGDDIDLFSVPISMCETNGHWGIECVCGMLYGCSSSPEHILDQGRMEMMFAFTISCDHWKWHMFSVQSFEEKSTE